METTLVIKTEHPYEVRAGSSDKWYDRNNAYARVRLMDGTLILCRHHYKRDYAYMMFTRVYWRPDENYPIPPRDDFSDQSWRVLWITDPVPGEKLRAILTRPEWGTAVQWESTAPVKEVLD